MGVPEKISILTFSSLFPNNVQPRHGIFVEQRLKQLLASNKISATVIAPVPWFPFSSSKFGQYGIFSRVLKKETRGTIDILHPRYFVVPKVGMNFSAVLMLAGVVKIVKKLLKSGYKIDLIDAHYFYPDGVAAVMLGKILAKPVVVTARGSDINLLPTFKIPKILIKWAANNCAAIITVSAALKKRLVKLGVAEDKIVVLRNGVNFSLFESVDRDLARTKTNVSGKVILSVGNLVKEKGHDLVIKAISILSDVNLVIIGAGVERSQLELLANKLDVSHRVRFENIVDQSDLKYYYSAVDMLVLASEREGMPNVVIESLVCGNPVVAMNVGGVTEIMSEKEFGIVVDKRDSDSLSQAISSLYSEMPDTLKICKLAKKFSWQEATQGQLDLFSKIMVDAHAK